MLIHLQKKVIGRLSIQTVKSKWLRQSSLVWDQCSTTPLKIKTSLGNETPNTKSSHIEHYVTSPPAKSCVSTRTKHTHTCNMFLITKGISYGSRLTFKDTDAPLPLLPEEEIEQLFQIKLDWKTEYKEEYNYKNDSKLECWQAHQLPTKLRCKITRQPAIERVEFNHSCRDVGIIR